jgi:hypothetical protein
MLSPVLIFLWEHRRIAMVAARATYFIHAFGLVSASSTRFLCCPCMGMVSMSFTEKYP